MSSNSRPRIFATEPIVRALRLDGAPSEPPSASVDRRVWAWRLPWSLLQVAQLVLADLDLVAVLQLVGLDPAAVDIRAVQRSEVVDVEAVLAADKQRVVARDRDVVEENARVGSSADRNPLVIEGEALPCAAAARANHQRRAVALHHLVDVDLVHLARLVDRVGHRRRLVLSLGTGEIGAALLAVVGPLGVDEAALGAMDRHRRPRSRSEVWSGARCDPRGSRRAAARHLP